MIPDDEITFDDILTRCGFGWYQWKILLLISLIDIVDGGEIIMISMI